MPSARGVYVPRVNHLSVVSWPLALTDTTAIDCDLYQTFYNCSLLAIGSYWHCRSLANQCSVTPDGTYSTTKVFRCKQKLFSHQSTISRYTIFRDHNE